MFVMISPLQAHLSETLTSLKFATKVISAVYRPPHHLTLYPRYIIHTLVLQRSRPKCEDLAFCWRVSPRLLHHGTILALENLTDACREAQLCISAWHRQRNRHGIYGCSPPSDNNVNTTVLILDFFDNAPNLQWNVPKQFSMIVSHRTTIYPRYL